MNVIPVYAKTKEVSSPRPKISPVHLLFSRIWQESVTGGPGAVLDFENIFQILVVPFFSLISFCVVIRSVYIFGVCYICIETPQCT